MPQSVRRDIANSEIKPGKAHSRRKASFYRKHRLAVPLDEVTARYPEPRPSPYVNQQAIRNRNRRLPLGAGAFAHREPIKNPVLNIHEGFAFSTMGRRTGNGCRTRPGVEADQDKPGNVTKRPFPRQNLLPFEITDVDGLLLPIAPASPKKPCSFIARQPPFARQSLFGQSDTDDKRRDAKHPEGRKNRDAKRSEVQGGSRFGYDIQLKRTLFSRQNGICPCCLQPITKIADSEVDHMVPLSRRGADEASNRLLAHTKCNREKHNKTLEEHWEWRVKVGLDVANIGRKHGLIR